MKIRTIKRRRDRSYFWQWSFQRRVVLAGPFRMVGAAQMLGTENLDIKRRFISSTVTGRAVAYGPNPNRLSEESERILEQYRKDHPGTEFWKDFILGKPIEPKDPQ